MRKTNKQTKKKWLYPLLCHTDAVRSSMKAEWEILYSKAVLIFQTETVWYLALFAVSTLVQYLVLFAVSMHTLGPILSRRVGGGCWQWKFSLLTWRILFGVTLSVNCFTWWSTPETICLAGVFTCFWTHGTQCLQQVTKCTQFQLECGTGNFTFYLHKGNTRKNWYMLV